jgi:hypothetical protein
VDEDANGSERKFLLHPEGAGIYASEETDGSGRSLVVMQKTTNPSAPEVVILWRNSSDGKGNRHWAISSLQGLPMSQQGSNYSSDKEIAGFIMAGAIPGQYKVTTVSGVVPIYVHSEQGKRKEEVAYIGNKVFTAARYANFLGYSPVFDQQSGTSGGSAPLGFIFGGLDGFQPALVNGLGDNTPKSIKDWLRSDRDSYYVAHYGEGARLGKNDSCSFILGEPYFTYQDSGYHKFNVMLSVVNGESVLSLNPQDPSQVRAVFDLGKWSSTARSRLL